MSRQALFRKIASVPQTLEQMMNDPMAILEKEPPMGIGEGLPNISVGSEEQPKDVISIKFLESAPELKTSTKPDRNGRFKNYAWINVEVLHPHEGYDCKAKQSVKLKVGDKATINLKRHANLWSWAKGVGDLKNRSFIIGTMGIVKTSKGNKAFDYRIKEVTGT